jgi:hypothetical protein
VEFTLKLPTSLRAPQTIICHKHMADLPTLRIVVDLLRQEFANFEEERSRKGISKGDANLTQTSKGAD